MSSIERDGVYSVLARCSISRPRTSASQAGGAK
jgi:hypothetical protein